MSEDQNSEVVQGTDENDVVVTGNGNDTINTAGGDDVALGGAGQDVITGDEVTSQQFELGVVDIIQDTVLEIDLGADAGLGDDILGFYVIDPESGEIGDVQVLYQPDATAPQDLSITQALSAGEKIEFFRIEDAMSLNFPTGLGAGDFKFAGADGGTAFAGADGLKLQFTPEGGVPADLAGVTSFSGAEKLLGAEGAPLAQAHTGDNPDVVNIGFGGSDLASAVDFTLELGAANIGNLTDERDADRQVEGGDDRLEGREGEDVLTGQGGDDLLVGGGAGSEWSLVDGKWVYDGSQVNTSPDPYWQQDGSNDVINGGEGEDVLLGNGGDDHLFAGAGEDRINGGTGNDFVKAGADNDIVNLEQGDDYAEGGIGADIVNAGDGDDVIHGDTGQGNMLGTSAVDANSIGGFTESSDWVVETDPDTGLSSMSQTIDTAAGEPYALSFDLASNLGAGQPAGTVEVLWNGEVISTTTATTGVYEKVELDIPGTGEPGVLTIRNIPSEEDAGPAINTDGPIFSYEKSIDIGGESIQIDAFAPGQAKLFQVIDGQLNVFDPETGVYQNAGDPTGLKVNAIGFNQQDDLIYGIAKRDGVDALGNPVSSKDLVMMDAAGNAYRIGETPVGDYVGDFDDQGNLWTFDSGLNRITKIDVDNLDADGNPQVDNFYMPADMFAGRTYDIAFSAEDQSFYAIESPRVAGGQGMVHKIDVSNFDGAGQPPITSVPISGTLIDGDMASGMPSGAFGAVFLDGDGNLYGGLNNGNHDLDGSTGNQGGIYKVNIDWDAGQSYAEYMKEAPRTGSNDGAMDPRSTDPFQEIDMSSTVLLRNPTLQLAEGGDDDLRGGAGNDEIFGNGGADRLFGSEGMDTLSGDSGADVMFGGEDADVMMGGLGNDYMEGGTGGDILQGGAGDDRLKGGEGADVMSGGDGNDKAFAGDGADLVDGGIGADTLLGDAGSDTINGGVGDDLVKAGIDDDIVDGGAGDDFLQGQSGADRISGGAGADKIVGGAGSDTIEGGAGNDNIWGGQWWHDGQSDTFVYTHGGGKDTIHDFETTHDQIDLSAYGLEFEDLSDRIIDRGWATEINLEGIDKSGGGDKIMLKSIKPEDLNEDNFIM